MAARKRLTKTKSGMQTAFVRFMLVVAFFIFWMGAVSVRLVHLQVNEHSKWKAKASSQRQDSIVTKTLRGTVFDRNGNTLAMSIRVKSLSADPGMIENVGEVSKKLGKILGKDPAEIAAAINDGKAGDRRFVWIAREIDDDKVAKIREEVFETENGAGDTLGRGLFWVGEQKRDYPHGSLAAHVIGFSNADDIGQAGIERSQEEYLKAERLRMVRQRDRQGRIFSEIELEKNPAKDVVITISKEIQHIAERALVKGIKATRAKSGKAIVLDPKTGEILAMANYPTFDPADFRKLKPGIWRNRSIQDQYAPGSVFKLVTYGAAIEEGFIKPESEIECGDGAITVGGYTFRDSHPVGTVSYAKAMAQSSNVGAIKTGLRIGADKYYDYARDFGFGQKTGIGLPSEATGVLHTPDKWEGTDLASMSIGYGIDVTALQTAMAFATIANDGVMVKPQIVREIQQNGNSLETFKPESRRIVRTETARALKTMLREVVADGTAKQARLNGYTSAGKTGTAWKYDRETGGINNEKYVSSFVGFAPADDPAVVIAIVVEEPRGAFRNGGDVSAPVFREIAESILPELKVAPDALFPEEFLKETGKPEKEKSSKPDPAGKKAAKSDPKKEIQKEDGKKKKKTGKPTPKPLEALIPDRSMRFGSRSVQERT